MTGLRVIDGVDVIADAVDKVADSPGLVESVPPCEKDVHRERCSRVNDNDIEGQATSLLVDIGEGKTVRLPIGQTMCCEEEVVVVRRGRIGRIMPDGDPI